MAGVVTGFLGSTILLFASLCIFAYMARNDRGDDRGLVGVPGAVAGLQDKAGTNLDQAIAAPPLDEPAGPAAVADVAGGPASDDVPLGVPDEPGPEANPPRGPDPDVPLALAFVQAITQGQEPRKARGNPVAPVIVDRLPARATCGDIRIDLLSARVQIIEAYNLFADRFGPTPEPYLAIRLRFTNTSSTRIIEFDGDFEFAIADNFGNDYNRAGPTIVPDDSFRDGPIRPGETIEGIAVFDSPLANAQHVVLTLPGSCLQCGEDTSFRIPTRLIGR